MKTQVASYGHCWIGNAPAGAKRCCEIEEFVDDSTMPHRITGPGRVIFKCSNHSNVADGALYSVVRAEGAQVVQARQLHGQDIKTRFVGRGSRRKLKLL